MMPATAQPRLGASVALVPMRMASSALFVCPELNLPAPWRGSDTFSYERHLVSVPI